MDVSEITKVASRKRLNVDAEKLREKVSRETSKIIKLKVAQDTAYWDLKEKLQQVEGNHERLQQNMVEVQMQHEAISGQYQEELRLRPDTLNKLSSTREICDVLEEYSERLKDTLARCKSDQASLCDAYQKSGRLVRDLKHEHEKRDEKRKQHLKFLQDKVKESNDNQGHWIKFCHSAKQKADNDIDELKKKLYELQRENSDLSSSCSVMNQQIEQAKIDLIAKNEELSRIQEATAKSLEEKDNRIKELNEVILQKDADLKKNTDALKALRGAVGNQEDFVCALRDENAKLTSQLAAMEGLLDAAEDCKRNLALTIETMNDDKQELESRIETLTSNKCDLQKMFEEKEARAAAEVYELESQINRMIKDKETLDEEISSVRDQYAAKAARVFELEANCEQLRSDVKKVENDYSEYRSECEARIAALKKALEDKERDIAKSACTIAQLMGEVGDAGETVARLEAALQRLRQDADLERQAANERDGIHKRQIENIQTQVAEKENELSKQMSIILDMRSEKDRLHEKIQSMQSKIDNIQKELSAPQPRAVPGDAPELDDNAVAFAVSPRVTHRADKPQAMKSPVMKVQKKRQADNKLDSMLFSMFSDTSMDEDSNMIDREEVDRRFEALARGQPLPPTPISSLKRRKAPSGGLRTIEEEDMSLSQIKKKMKHNEPRKFFKNVRTGNKK